MAFARTTSTASQSSWFSAKYQSNANEESQLLQQAQSANGTNSIVASLLNTAENIIQQTTEIYTAEQALVNAQSSIPNISSANKAELAKLTKNMDSMLQQRKQKSKLAQPHTHGGKQQDTKIHGALETKLTDIENQIADLKNVDHLASANPYDSAIATLQASILHLQYAEIHYTKEAIALEAQASASGSTGESSTAGNSTSGTGNSTSNSTGNNTISNITGP